MHVRKTLKIESTRIPVNSNRPRYALSNVLPVYLRHAAVSTTQPLRVSSPPLQPTGYFVPPRIDTLSWTRWPERRRECFQTLHLDDAVRRCWTQTQSGAGHTVNRQLSLRASISESACYVYARSPRRMPTNVALS